MLKAISTIVLLGVTFSVSANDSRHFSDSAANGYEKPAFKQNAAFSGSRHDERYKTPRYSKHSSQQAYAEPYRKAQHNQTPYGFKHSNFDNRYEQRYVQTNHGYHHPGKLTKSHKVLSQLKRNHVLPDHMAYGRVPMQVESRLGHLPSHLMRVAIGRDIAVIHIANRVVHEIIRGLL